MYNMYVFTKENVYKYVFIRYLESITQAFGLDSRECKCLEYLFIYLLLLFSLILIICQSRLESASFQAHL
jgi:hypothetical protein